MWPISQVIPHSKCIYGRICECGESYIILIHIYMWWSVCCWLVAFPFLWYGCLFRWFARASRVSCRSKQSIRQSVQKQTKRNGKKHYIYTHILHIVRREWYLNICIYMTNFFFCCCEARHRKSQHTHVVQSTSENIQKADRRTKMRKKTLYKSLYI